MRMALKPADLGRGTMWSIDNERQGPVGTGRLCSRPYLA